MKYTLNHLLLAGQIIDRGQLPAEYRRELNHRAKAGRLIKTTQVLGGKEFACWFVRGKKSLESS